MSTPPRLPLGIRDAALQAIVLQSDHYREVSGERLARRWEYAIDVALQKITSFPLINQVHTIQQATGKSIRRQVIPGFRKHGFFYTVSPDGQTVTVLHMLHGARNLLAALSATDEQ